MITGALRSSRRRWKSHSERFSGRDASKRQAVGKAERGSKCENGVTHPYWL